jgi:hypothetical protein
MTTHEVNGPGLAKAAILRATAASCLPERGDQPRSRRYQRRAGTFSCATCGSASRDAPAFDAQGRESNAKSGSPRSRTTGSGSCSRGDATNPGPGRHEWPARPVPLRSHKRRHRIASRWEPTARGQCAAITPCGAGGGGTLSFDGTARHPSVSVASKILSGATSTEYTDAFVFDCPFWERADTLASHGIRRIREPWPAPWAARSARSIDRSRTRSS